MPLTLDQVQPLHSGTVDAQRAACSLQRRREPARPAGRFLAPRTPPDRQPGGVAGRPAVTRTFTADAPAPYPARSSASLRTPEAEVMRVLSDTRTAVFATEYASGRRRYSYWRPVDSDTGRGGCYVALPTDACEQLRATGRITLSEPVHDPSKTTYRVRSTRASTTSARAARPRDRAPRDRAA
ncbi:hypothetical protein [Streptomyces sp. NPDC088812]|uniref:hypothetical protein n=1 Tax=Streptomyces sp. NPDC088812 TaxID=3365905 RepID=UPI003807CEBC